MKGWTGNILRVDLSKSSHKLGLAGIPALVSRGGAGRHGHDRLKDGDRGLASGMSSGG